jgi:hypothetical protein
MCVIDIELSSSLNIHESAMLDGPLLLMPLPLPLLARLALPIGPVDRLLRHGGSSGRRQLLDYKYNNLREL